MTFLLAAFVAFVTIAHNRLHDRAMAAAARAAVGSPWSPMAQTLCAISTGKTIAQVADEAKLQLEVAEWCLQELVRHKLVTINQSGGGVPLYWFTPAGSDLAEELREWL